MQISISGQHLDVTPALREHIEEKIDKISHHFDHLTSTHIVLQIEKNRHKAEANINARGVQFHAAGEADDMYAAIDAMVSKLDRQVLKHKEKVSDHHADSARPAE
ncbi:MAG: ribosomal subunit interface protein [marine bacterium B5-7]|nr:MAG: ribosomal subunit interface protein [marine bacterium B5-7]